MATEAEHRESDQGVGECEAESDAGHEPDLRIHCYLEDMLDRGKDRGPVRHDASLQLHERGNPAPSGPPHPLVEGLGGLVVGLLEDHPEAFLEVVARPRLGSVCTIQASLTFCFSVRSSGFFQSA